RDTAEFFLSGRNVPWWLAGTSMVATTFAADTPLVVTGLVAKNGIAGNWLWWNLLASGMLTVFFYAGLWRRAGVVTDIELIEMRLVNELAVRFVGADGSVAGGDAILVLRGRVSALAFVPELGSLSMQILPFFVHMAVNWSTAWSHAGEWCGG